MGRQANNALIIGVLLSLGATTALADQYHYNNFLMGDRAIGLGGAYTAIADDASGVVYNPAGIAFALSNDISGSANAYYRKWIRYRKTIGDQDFTENVEGTVPSFFGGINKLDRIIPGLVAGFGIYSTDNEVRNQNDFIGEYAPLSLNRFHRTVTQRASTQHFAAIAGYRIGAGMSIGFGASYLLIDELVQEFQTSRQAKTGFTNAKNSECTTGFCIATRTQNIREQLKAEAVQPIMGAQFAFSDFSFGLTIKYPISVKQNYEYDGDFEFAELSRNSTGGAITSGSQCSNAICTGVTTNATSALTNDGPLGTMPMEARFGAAWFANSRLLLSTDTIYHGAVTDAKVASYNKNSVIDYAFGGEFYMTPSLPLRIGAFTNNDARPKVDPAKAGQADHIDYMGVSTFLAWVQPSSQVSFGVVLQQGTGDAQKLGDTTVQKVDATAATLAFSATHSL